MSSQCRGIAATEIAGRSWDTRERAPGILRRGRDTPSHKETARQAEGNEHPFCSDTLPHSNSVSLFTCHRDTEQAGLDSTTANTSAGHRGQRKQQQEQAGAHHPPCKPQAQSHRVLSVTWVWHYPKDGQRCLTCPTPSALASSPAAGPPMPLSSFHLGQRRKRCSPVQSHAWAWAHYLFLGGKHKERQDTDRSARLGCATHCFTYFLALLFTNLKVKKVLGMKKHKAEEGCRKSLVMHSLYPLDSLVQERQQNSLPTVCGLPQPTDIRLW